MCRDIVPFKVTMAGSYARQEGARASADEMQSVVQSAAPAVRERNIIHAQQVWLMVTVAPWTEAVDSTGTLAPLRLVHRPPVSDGFLLMKSATSSARSEMLIRFDTQRSYPKEQTRNITLVGGFVHQQSGDDLRKILLGDADRLTPTC